MEGLKICPFCGGIPKMSQGRFNGKDTSYVMCSECGARGEFFVMSHGYASDERAAEAWNRRTRDATI